MRAKKTLTAPALVLFMLMLSIGSRYIDPAVLGYGNQLYLSLIILQLIIYVLPCIFYCKLCGSGYSLKLNLRLIPPGRIGLMLLTFPVLIAGSALIKLFLSYIGAAGTEFAGYESMVAITDATTFTDILYIITTFAVLPAIAEEFAFRGVILTEYNAGGSGAVQSLLFGSLLFGLIQFKPDMLLLYIFIGAVLSFTVYVTRSLLAAVIIHMLYNIFNIFFEGYIIRLVGVPENLMLTLFIVASLFLFFLILMFSETERLYHNDGLVPEDEYDDDDEKRQKTGGLHALGEAILSPALLLCIGVFIAGSFI
jgi:membrane protease YdiL (CAAX protease family)